MSTGVIFQGIWRRLLNSGTLPSAGLLLSASLQLLDSAIESAAYFFIGGSLAKQLDSLIEDKLQIPNILGSGLIPLLLRLTLHLFLMFIVIIFARTFVEMIPTPLSGQVGPSMGSVLLVWVIMLQSPGLVQNVKNLLEYTNFY